MISDGEELHAALMKHRTTVWATFEAATEGLPQLARAPFLEEAREAVYPKIDLCVEVRDVLPGSLYGVIAGERPRSLMDELFKRRLWVGKGLVASFDDLVDPDIGRKLLSLRLFNTVVISGLLDATQFRDSPSFESFGDREVFGVGWRLKSCRLLSVDHQSTRRNG